MGRSRVHGNICAHLSAPLNQAARPQLPEQPAGAPSCKRAARLPGRLVPAAAIWKASVATVAVRAGARLDKALDITHPPPLGRRGFTPELCLGLRSSLLSDPSVFYFGFHLFVYLQPLTAPPPPTPPFFSSRLQTEPLPRTALLACLEFTYVNESRCCS